MAMRSLSRSSRGSARRSAIMSLTYVVELRACPLDERQVLGQVVVEDAEDVGGPGREELPVLGRRAEELADDRDRVGLADVGHQLALALAGDPVDQLADHGPHGGAQPVGRGGREGRGDEAAQPGVAAPSMVRMDWRRSAAGGRRPASSGACSIMESAEWKRLSRRIAVTSCRLVTA